MEKATLFQCLIDVLIYLLLLFVIKKQFNAGFLSNRNIRIILWLSLFFCLFPYWGGDYFHYLADYQDLRKGELHNLEMVYLTVAQLAPSYLFFRLYIWGAVIIGINYLGKKLAIYDLRENFIVVFVCTSLVFLSYARVSLPMVLINCGLAIICISTKKKCNTIIGLLLLVVSVAFHKSALFGVAVAIAAVITSLAGSKKVMILGLIALPSLLAMADEQLLLFASESATQESSLNIYTAQAYITDDSFLPTEGIGIKVQNILTRSGYFISAAIYVLVLFSKHDLRLPFYIRVCANSLLIIVITASSMLFLNSMNGYVLFYRLLLFASIPMVVFLAYCYKNGIKSTLTKIAIYTFMIGSLYTLVYSTYNTI